MQVLYDHVYCNKGYLCNNKHKTGLIERIENGQIMTFIAKWIAHQEVAVRIEYNLRDLTAYTLAILDTEPLVTLRNTCKSPPPTLYVVSVCEGVEVD